MESLKRCPNLEHTYRPRSGMLECLIFITLVVSTVLIVAVLAVVLIEQPELTPWLRVR